MANAEHTQMQGSAGAAVHFKDALEDAERLLTYAAEMGVKVDDETRSAVLHARAAFPNEWSVDTTDKLLLALTHLAAGLKPVSAASLKAYQAETRPTMRTYLIVAIALSAVIIPVSIATFVSSSISEEIRSDIAKANALTVKLTVELGPPPRPEIGTSDELADLQEYAATVRLIYARARRLNVLVFPHVQVPPSLVPPEGNAAQKAEYLKKKFELGIPLDNLPEARNAMTLTYQDVRYFAQAIASDILTFYGAINSCILPILYALLGTCAYLLRTFEDQMISRTFLPSRANSARFLIAAIGGTVIGLFSGFSTQASASPLAVAFLVGYAVEVFFAFLEGLIKSFTRSTPTSSSVGAGTGKT
jgi:hypothetical protein